MTLLAELNHELKPIDWGWCRDLHMINQIRKKTYLYRKYIMLVAVVNQSVKNYANT